MGILVWGVAGGLIALGLFLILVRGRTSDVDEVMSRFGSAEDRPGWRRPSASVWDESKSAAGDDPPADQGGEREAPPL